MKTRNTTTAVWLFLITIFALFATQPSWCSSNFSFPSTSPLAGCDVATFPSNSPEGMVVLPTGQVLVAVYSDGIYTFTMPASLQGCPTTPPAAVKLSSRHVRGMAMALDGTIYANDNSGNVCVVNPSNGGCAPITSLGIVGGLGMALDPRTGNIDITVNPSGGKPGVVEISGLPNNPLAHTLVTLTNATFADGLAWSCDGTFLLVADKYGSQVVAWDRPNNLLYYLPIPGSPDGMAFGAPGTPLATHAYTNTNDGHVYQFDLPTKPANVIDVADNGTDGDFVTVDSQGNLLATQTGLITALYWKHGHNDGGFVLPGGALCMSLHCAAKAATNPRCLSGQNATTVAALADAACSTSECGGCSTKNLELSTLITLLNDLNVDGCLNAALTGAQAIYHECPCNPNPLSCPMPCNTCACNPAYCATSPVGGEWLQGDDPELQGFVERHQR